MFNVNSSELRLRFNQIIQAIRESGGSGGAATPLSSFINKSEPKHIRFPPVQVEGLAPVTGGTHPSVLHFPRGWNGYKYWLLYTPYPGVRNENPTIVASNDGETFETPVGLQNPIAMPPEAPKYYSDTELIMVNNNTMRAYWREYAANTGDESRLLYKESSNGSDWGEMQVCTLTPYQDPISPCIVKVKSNKWYLWIGSNSKAMTRYESTNGITWTNPQECITNYDEFGFNWHSQIWATTTGYHALAAIRNVALSTTDGLYTDLYYGKSKDGINWVFDENAVQSRGEYGMKNYRVYRSCAVQAEGRYKLYISGYGSESEQIHVVTADKVGDLATW